LKALWLEEKIFKGKELSVGKIEFAYSKHFHRLLQLRLRVLKHVRSLLEVALAGCESLSKNGTVQ
jgi:hypothetical protein